jgi:hypothetical protein
MNQREKILGAFVLLLVVAWAGSVWYGHYQEKLTARRAAVQDAKSRLANVNLALAEGRMAVQQLEAWQERSLPSSRERALSLYKAWLLAKAKDAGLSVDDIKPSARTSASAAFTTIGYRIEATGTLPAVAAMLYEFYRSPQLHQITQLRLSRPVGDSPIRVTFEVEALSLPGAATDSLPEGDSKRLKLASLEAYQKSLSERDLVTVFAEKGPATTEATVSATADDSEHARFSATVPGARGLQAWINVSTTGETLHFTAGEPLKVGQLEGQILSIEPRSLTYQTGEKKFRVPLGQSLRGGKELDADTATSSEPPPRGRRRSFAPGEENFKRPRPRPEPAAPPQTTSAL